MDKSAIRDNVWIFHSPLFIKGFEHCAKTLFQLTRDFIQKAF